MAPVLAFDIETIPDVAGIRRLHGLPEGLADQEVAEVAFQKRRAQTGSDFLPPHLQRVLVISCVLRDAEQLRIWSIGAPAEDEGAAIQRFYDGIERYVPQLVSWNGGGFDLPVLNYRGLLHGVSAPRFWEQGDEDRDFKWNNYVNRYHTRHLDLMDVLAMYQPRNNAPLDEVAQLAGLPGKIGMEGAAVWREYQSGAIAQIRNYCEADCANTYLLFLRFQLLRGALERAQYKRECALVRTTLEKLKEPHWGEFLERWRDPLAR
ncbi:MAG TPA: 3'-5' exonuclease [Burkholderiales bacterium]|nr:3'-5' exonuclease [Burkholderiales bacterium]